MTNTIRVTIVDDSAVIRGFTKRILESDSSIEVAASVGNGEHAVRTVRQQDIDVAVLDIEMPTMDGITALPLIIEAKPKIRVIMSSTLTTRNAEISLKALRLGAADYIPKPSVDPMLRSVVKVYGPRVLTVKFTGMGKDGLKGSEAVVAAGGTIVAQDEETSVVWGMPGAVATAGVCSAVLPLREIAPHITTFKTRAPA